MRFIYLLLLVAVVYSCPREQRETTAHYGSAPTISEAFDTRFFASLHQVETSGSLSPPRGDGGRARGPLQIHSTYFDDAREHNRARGYRWFPAATVYSECDDLAISRGVVRAYMDRYAASAWARGDAAHCARVHNGGPRGATKRSTDAYAAKFMRVFTGSSP